MKNDILQIVNTIIESINLYTKSTSQFVFKFLYNVRNLLILNSCLRYVSKELQKYYEIVQHIFYG